MHILYFNCFILSTLIFITLSLYEPLCFKTLAVLQYLPLLSDSVEAQLLFDLGLQVFLVPKCSVNAREQKALLICSVSVVELYHIRVEVIVRVINSFKVVAIIRLPVALQVVVFLPAYTMFEGLGEKVGRVLIEC